jgi:hypothetical protein
MNLAAEGARLAGRTWTEDELSVLTDARVRGVLAAHALASAGRGQAARQSLQGIAGTGTASQALALLQARTWLALGSPEQAGVVLRRVGQVLPAEEIVWHEVLLGGVAPAMGTRLLLDSLEDPLPPGVLERRVTGWIVHALARPDPRTAEALTRRLQHEAPQLTATGLAALWAYCGVAGDGDSERFWRERLGAKIDRTIPTLHATVLTVPFLRIIAERVPLPIELVCGLMAATRPEPEARGGGAAREDATAARIST